jgi:hypothetical protein
MINNTNLTMREFWNGSDTNSLFPVTGREGPQGCEKSWLPHLLENRLTDGGEVVNLTCRPHFTPRKIPGTHFC